MIKTPAPCPQDGQTRLSDADARLAALAARARDEMERIEGFGRPWLPAPEGAAFNVVICGAGMSGLAAAFGLKRRGVEGVAVIDERAPGLEGPWRHSARMKTLRSPKHLAGPDLGVPALTPRSWFEAVYGAEAFATLDRVDRHDWWSYLAWFRDITQPRVHNQCRLLSVAPHAFGLELRLEGGDLPSRIICKRLVVATGVGAPRIPEFMRELPKAYWTHSAEPAAALEFAGREFFVLGAGASALDWAVAALEGGARRVRLYAREARYPRTEVLDWTNFPGFLDHFAELDDARRWRFAENYFRLKPPPTQDQYDRACAYPQFSQALGCAWRETRLVNGRVVVRHDAGESEADHILLGAGYETDLAALEPLAHIAPLAEFWRDRPCARSTDLGRLVGAHPYLGEGFELRAKDPGRDGWISRIHLFNPAAMPSLGPISNGLTGMKSGAPRLTRVVAGALFREAADGFAAALEAYDHPHFDPRGRDRANIGEPP